MKAEFWIFGHCAVFFMIVTPSYYFITAGSDSGVDWTGFAALVMCTLLVTMITIYLGVHARQMEPRPEDRKDAEIADGAGELGFFPPYSWWPLWCGAVVALLAFAIAMGTWWLFVMGLGFGILALSGWIFEFYRGEHAH